MSGSDGSSPFVRPYAVTGGRTGEESQLAIEALVATTGRGREVMHTLVPEYEAVCRMCGEEVKSVAEIAALLGVPLGVAAVVVDDLVQYGLVFVEPTGGDAVPDIQLLERVLSGLQNL